MLLWNPCRPARSCSSRVDTHCIESARCTAPRPATSPCSATTRSPTRCRPTCSSRSVTGGPNPLQLGEAFVGEGVNPPHATPVLGPRDGPVGPAWANALATPTAGHAPFVVVLHPGLPVKPFTLLVNKARIESETHARMTWGPAQAGAAGGVADAVAKNIVFDIDDVLIAAVWVDPAADDAEAVFSNNVEATLRALAMGQQGLPSAADIQERRADLWNPFFRIP